LADIFFSYARRDLKRVEALVAALGNRGWSMWWDPDVHGGDSWSDVIEAELAQAKCVIVAWSKQSAKSEWVREEARIANKVRKLVPVLLEPMDPPFGFGGVQTVDLSGWDGNREASEFLRLCTAVQRKLDGLTSSSPPASPPPKSQTTLSPADGKQRAGALMESREPAELKQEAVVSGSPETARPRQRRAGWLRGMILRGTGFGIVSDILIGIAGAFVANVLFPKLGIYLGSGMISEIIYSAIGAIILLLIVRLIRTGGRF
jgi:uncharacterized membrane protein YeaQ/YmgE (transglycosylase-associated protein family)